MFHLNRNQATNERFRDPNIQNIAENVHSWEKKPILNGVMNKTI